MAVVSDRPQPQYMSALDKANRIRLGRAELKREVASGERQLADVVLEVPWQAETATLAELLMAQHRWGRAKMLRFLRVMAVSEAKRLGDLTDRQRNVVAARLRGEQVDDVFGRWAG